MSGNEQQKHRVRNDSLAHTTVCRSKLNSNLHGTLLAAFDLFAPGSGLFLWLVGVQVISQ
jgi:hypothetical protein